MKTLRFFILIALSGIIVSACGSDDNNAAAPAAGPNNNNSGFYISDNDCYRSSNNQRVSNSNCSGNDYAIRGGQCYRGSERTALNNCTPNTYYMSDNGCYDRSGNTVTDNRCGNYDDDHYDNEYDYDNNASNACRGPHLFFDDDGEIYEVNCDGRSRSGNCSEYYLFDIEDQNWVHCG